MNTVRAFIRLAGMRRRAGGNLRQSMAWAAGLLYRNHQSGKQRQHTDRRVEVERAARQRL